MILYNGMQCSFANLHMFYSSHRYFLNYRFIVVHMSPNIAKSFFELLGPCIVTTILHLSAAWWHVIKESTLSFHGATLRFINGRRLFGASSPSTVALFSNGLLEEMQNTTPALKRKSHRKMEIAGIHWFQTLSKKIELIPLKQYVKPKKNP